MKTPAGSMRMRRAMRLTVAALICLSAGSVFAHGWKAPKEAASMKNPVPASDRSVERGRALFSANCVACHGSSATGDGPLAASLSPPPADLVRVSGHHPDGDFFWKIANGRGPMPGFESSLAEKQIWDLVNYIQSLKPAH